MPIAVLLEIIQGLAAVAPEIPSVVSLVETALDIGRTGTVTPAQEASIRADLDAVRAQIDAA